MGLVEKYPDKVHFCQYNTGGIGEILETYMDGDIERKKMVRKVARVPIPLMAAIQRGDFRETNKYEKGKFGTEEIVYCEDGDLAPYDPANFYSPEQIDDYLYKIVEGRRKYTMEIAQEGLSPEILKYAEKSFEIQPVKKKLHPVPADVPKDEEVEEVEVTPDTPTPIPDWETKSRPKRVILGRYR